MKNNCYVDFHVIQTVPPSCVNRDDTGSPKTSMYGGKMRARVSSQSWKHAMRIMFEDLFSPEYLGTRTKRIHQLIISKILEAKPELADNPKKLNTEIVNLFKNAGITLKMKKKSDEIEGTDALFFMSNRQAELIAKIYLEKTENKSDDDYKTELKQALKVYPSVDMALFGRMVASDPSLNYDATAQVAHAISTHEVQTEYDYFTAVDDLAPEDNAGAGHLGTIEYNSFTMYRYASVNIKELTVYLQEDTAEAVKNFAKAFILSMPAGKQNTFANRTVPDFVYVTIREDQPVNFCAAFEKPVFARSEGYVIPSIQRLDEYAKKVYKNFVDAPNKSFAIGEDGILSEAQHVSIKELFDALEISVDEFQTQG